LWFNYLDEQDVFTVEPVKRSCMADVFHFFNTCVPAGAEISPDNKGSAGIAAQPVRHHRIGSIFNHFVMIPASQQRYWNYLQGISGLSV